MRRYKLSTALFAVMIIAVSCTVPETRYVDVETGHQSGVEAERQMDVEAVVQAEPVEFDPDSVTPEVYENTKQAIFHFIQGLNSIIKHRRYSAWTQYLDTDYYQYINSPYYLQELSKSGTLVARKIVLSNAYDYFMHVVVPSRSNDRVDEIEFVSETRIKAISIENGNRVIIYDLEKTQDSWKIVMPNFTR
ncbi:MAG: hypothetical protein LBD86_00840 [Spirochaetaceae bacterium]|jgi:hypothetical protein|nr:hypothetical protein [Spirochaetaceae bacterium]